MTSPVIIERPNRWQTTLLLSILYVVWFPTIWLASYSTKTLGTSLVLFSVPFVGAMRRSLIQASLVSALAFCFGFPLCLAYGLFKIPGRRLVVALLILPLFIPTFVWAIGWSSIRLFFPYRRQHFFDGLSGTVLASSTQCIPLV